MRSMTLAVAFALGLVAVSAAAQQGASQTGSMGMHGMMRQEGMTMPMMGMGSGCGMMGQGRMPMTGMHGSMDGMMPMMGMADRTEGRVAFLKAELKITDAQLPQWNVFADALRANARKMGEMMQGCMARSGSMMQGGAMPGLSDRLAMQEQHMTAHLEALKAMRAALQPLLAVLSDEQKRTADALL